MVRGDQLSFHDEAGRVWTAVLAAGGAVQSWSLAEGGAPSIWWGHNDDWVILSDRERDVQVRWREVLLEPLDGEPVRLERPAAYRLGPCRSPALPTPASGVPSPGGSPSGRSS